MRIFRSRALMCSASLFALCPNAFAADEQLASAAAMIDDIIVTASRTAVPLRSVGSAIDVLTAEDIAARPRFEVSDLLREVPGIAVSRSGQRGANTQVRVRGAEANHTLVIINGIEVGDPFSNSEFDFGNLLTDDVERIEVLRGAQSAIYGAQAIGGVINIITTQGKGPTKYSAQAQGGSFGTYALSSAASGGRENYGFAGSVAYFDTEGVSQAAIGNEEDGHNNLTLNVSGRADLNEIFDVSLAARYTRAFGEEDTQDFTPGSPTLGLVIDSDDYHRTKTAYGRATVGAKLFDGAWEHRIASAITDVRKSNFAFGAFSFGSFSQKVVASYQTDATITDEEHGLSHAVTGYIELKEETFENKSGFPGPQNQRKSTQDMGYVGEYRLGIADQFFLTGAVRYDDNDLFRNATTYRVSGAWQVPGSGLKFRGSYGTGVAKPGFFELFGFDPTSFVGNPNLQPEKSRGWDIGTDISFAGDSAYVSVTYFRTTLTGEIATDFSVFPFTVLNQAGESLRKGLEVSARYALSPAWLLTATYTHTSAREPDGAQEVRRPRNVASFTASYKFLEERARVGLSVDYNGAMEDVVFTPTVPNGRAILKSYTLITASASYDITEWAQFFGRVENLADDSYQEVFSYNTLGIGAYAGFRLRFGG